MNDTNSKILTPAQLDEFVENGMLHLHGCFSKQMAREWTDHAYVRLGYKKSDPATWTLARTHLTPHRTTTFAQLSPRAHQAASELVGGASRVDNSAGFWPDGFIINFRDESNQPWQAPTAQSPGWHKDGDWFRHYLDSPEQGLLMIFVFSDIAHRGGGTFVARDSVAPVARFLAERPEGVHPTEFNFKELVSSCRDFVEITGEAGDVVLMHPYILHAISQNHSGIPRFITNPAVHLREPMNFNRADARELSAVERGVLRGLGVDRFDFRAAGKRERIVPERDRIQAKALEEEKKRLAAAASPVNS